MEGLPPRTWAAIGLAVVVLVTAVMLPRHDPRQTYLGSLATETKENIR